MYERFVGLDIGSDTIKITLIKRGLRDVKLLQTIQFKSPDSPQAISAVFNKVFTENSLPKSDIATALPNNPVSIRLLKFPFFDSKKIDQIYEFELENISPFDLVDKVHGYHLVKRGEGSEAVVCMFEKEQMKNLIHLCDRGGIDPKVVTFAPIAFSALDDFLPQERPLALINIGASRMNFSLFDREGIRHVRSSSKAGNFITETISRTLGISFEEAESIKYGGLKINKNVTEEALTPVLDEIKRTLRFFEIEIKEEIKTVLISGGTSLMPGISDYIGREVKKDVERLFIPDLGEDNSPIFAESFAIALYGSLNKRRLNLRKGEFKYAGKDDDLKKVFIIPAVLFSLLIFFSLYRFGERYFELKDLVKSMEAETQKSVRGMFPNVKVIPRPVVFMESEVKKVREKLELIEGIRGKYTPLNLLRGISVSIPSNVGLTVDEVNFVDDGMVRLQGKCNSYEEVSRIEKAFSGAGVFKQVLRDSIDKDADNTVKFQITLVLK